MKKNDKKEVRSINSNEDLYNDFQLEQLEERLEMGIFWGCNADCGTYCTINEVCGVEVDTGGGGGVYKPLLQK